MITYGDIHNAQVLDWHAQTRTLTASDVCAALRKARETGRDRALAHKLALGDSLTLDARDFVDNWQ